MLNNDVFLPLKVVLILTNNVDPDEMQHYAAFHIILRFIWVFTVCITTRLGVSSIQKVKG